MTNAVGPAEHAARIAAARDRMLAFAAACPDSDWRSRPLSDQGDDRPVGVIADHVAHAYAYIADWIRQILDGAELRLDATVVDRLNAEHAVMAGEVTQTTAADHLRRSGDAIVTLVAALSVTELEAGGGRVGRLAEIAARHADDHRSDIKRALLR